MLFGTIICPNRCSSEIISPEVSDNIPNTWRAVPIADFASDAPSVVDQRISDAMAKGGSGYQYQVKQDIQTLRDKHAIIQKQNEAIGSQKNTGDTTRSHRAISASPILPPRGPNWASTAPIRRRARM